MSVPPFTWDAAGIAVISPQFQSAGAVFCKASVDVIFPLVKGSIKAALELSMVTVIAIKASRSRRLLHRGLSVPSPRRRHPEIHIAGGEACEGQNHLRWSAFR